MKRTLKWALCIAMIALVAMSMVIMGSAAYSELDGVYVSVGQDEGVTIEFCPEVDGIYNFYSTGDCDTYVTIYDEEGYYMDSDDDGAEDYNFSLKVNLEANKTYSLHVSLYGGAAGEFYVYSESISFKEITTETLDVTIVENGYEYIKFVPEEDSLYEFSCKVENGNLVAVLYDGNFNRICDESNLGYDDHISIVRELYAGETYIFQLGQYGFLGEFQDYVSCSVSVENCNLLEFDNGLVEVNSKYAYIKFVPAKTGIYKFYSTGNCDAVARLYDSGMYYISMNDDFYGDINFQIKEMLMEGQTYYLKVELVDDEYLSNLPFEVGVELCEMYQFSETGSFISNESNVYIKIVPEADGIYNFCSNGSFDTYIELYDDYMNGLVSKYNPSGDVCFDAYLYKDHVYYLKIESYGFDTEYTVQMSQYDILEFSSDNTVVVNNENAYIAFNPEVSGAYRFYSEGNYDTYIELFYENLYCLDVNDNSGDGNNFNLKVLLNSNNTYYLKVTSYNTIANGNSYIVKAEPIKEQMQSHVSVDITEDDYSYFYTFVPEISGMYRFYANADGNVSASWNVHDVEDYYTLIESDAVSGVQGYEYACACYLESGKEYIIYLYDEEYGYMLNGKTGNIDLYVEKGENGWFLVGDSWDLFWIYIENGEILTNTWAISPEGWVYLDEEGCAVTNTWMEDSQGWLYLGDHGEMATNKLVYGFEYDDFRYVDANGRMVKEQWVYVTDSFITDEPYWSYFDSEGVIAKDQWFSDSKGWYYVDYLGRMVTDGLAYGEGEYEVYYMDSNGYMVTNKWVFFSEEEFGVDFWAFFGVDGVVVRNQWIADSHGWCYVNEEAMMVTNEWVQDSVGWCYIGADGYCVTNQWVEDSNGWCYLDENGRMATNKWIKDSQGWCYVGADGYCLTNCWQQDSYGWCYLDENGRMATNTWVMDSVGWCYIGADGYAVTSCWKQDSHGWCYLDENGSMTKSDWVLDGDVWYYLDGDGYMVTGTYYVDGILYTFADNGAWIG